MAESATAVPASPTAASAVGHGSNRPWVEKYRPATLDDVVAHEQILQTIRRLVENDTIPHLLFYGPPGTGKTSTVQALCRQLYGQRVRGNVLEMNASDDRGIDVVRNEIKDFASTGQVLLFNAPQAGGTSKHPGVKIIVLDEADQMSNEAQAALRRVIEKYTRNVRFCIICNHVNKIIPALQSRCTRFRFGPVKKKQIIGRLRHIVESESIKADDAGLTSAFKLSGGDMRRCLNMMQASALTFKEITEDAVYRSAGYPTPNEVRAIVEITLSTGFTEAWKGVSDRMVQHGLSVVDLIREMHPLIQHTDLPQDAKLHCFIKLADIEYNLNAGTSESIALGAVIGVMQIVRESVTRGKPIAQIMPSDPTLF